MIQIVLYALFSSKKDVNEKLSHNLWLLEYFLCNNWITRILLLQNKDGLTCIFGKKNKKSGKYKRMFTIYTNCSNDQELMVISNPLELAILKIFLFFVINIKCLMFSKKNDCVHFIYFTPIGECNGKLV